MSSPPLDYRRKLVAMDALMTWRRQARAEGKTVVWTNGCFDLLHMGHVQSLLDARAEGDFLVVGVNSDESVRALKGPRRPVVPAAQRVALLAALECVDFVVAFEETTPIESLRRLQPDVHCKGNEYAPPEGKPIPEAEVITAYGGRIAFLPKVPDLSTTDVIRRILEGQP